MKEHQCLLRNAPDRVLARLRILVDDRRLPREVSFEDCLSHGIYDSKEDVIIITVKAATLRFPVIDLVERPKTLTVNDEPTRGGKRLREKD